MIQRRAIDPSGHLGLFYDKNQDYVLEGQTVIGEGQKFQLHESIKCELIDGNTDKSRNLLQMVGIDDDLRLNILLNPKLRTGIAALIDYPCPIDNYTRFLYTFYSDREQRLPDDPTDARKWIKSLVRPADATHIITAVSFGIDVVVVLQLPRKDHTVRKIDIALEKVLAGLKNPNDVYNFTADDENFLEKITETKAYSNVYELTKMSSLLEICQYLNGHKQKRDMYRLLTFTLQPIEWLYLKDEEQSISYIPLEKNSSGKIERYFIELSNQLRNSKHSLDNNVSKLLSGYLEEPLHEAINEWRNLHEAYNEEIERFRQLVFDICRDNKNASEMDQALRSQNQTTLKENIRKLTKKLNGLEAKGQLICSLKEQGFKYCYVTEQKVNKNDTEKTLERTLIEDNQCDRILCTDDCLNDKNQSGIKKLRDQLAQEKMTNSNLRLIYTDFSYCTYELQGMVIFPSNKQENDKNIIRPPSPETQTFVTPPSSTKNEIINILLLGESGVGKSTFINAFVNYLTFETFEQAESSSPVVLIPVTFLMTVGDDFQERIVKFGDLDALNNEDFDHPGQSVTQHCKSYLFKLNHTDGKKLRIIDTPGFGDTRGLDQDDDNMQHILEYINNLTHLNAICFLFKSNASQINKFFPTCLTQLLDFLGHDAKKNIIFCFTNGRSTFYNPGDTAPLLTATFQSHSIRNIPLKKANAFCFDSESFRYLVALQDGVVFNDVEKDEYKMSWSTSVKESNRLIEYVDRGENICRIEGGCQSIKRAQFQIVCMIRPILEAVRNILRNNILYEMKTPKKMIKICPKEIHRPAYICLSCPDLLVQVGHFWVINDYPHEIQNKCHVCDCASSKHVIMNYVLRFDSSDSLSNYDVKKMNNILGELCLGSSKFAYFLINVARSTKEDPFLVGVNRMIHEEESIYNKKKQSNDYNSQLVRRLNDIQAQYIKQMKNAGPNQQQSRLEDIYEWIKTIRKYPMVHEQMEAVTEGQKRRMEQSEYDMSKDPTST